MACGLSTTDSTNHMDLWEARLRLCRTVDLSSSAVRYLSLWARSFTVLVLWNRSAIVCIVILLTQLEDGFVRTLYSVYARLHLIKGKIRAKNPILEPFFFFFFWFPLKNLTDLKLLC